MKKAVFLDRDGVLNRSILIDGVPTAPTCIEDVEVLDGVVEAIKILRDNRYVPIVVTNQPDVARGKTTQSHIHEINSYIGAATKIDYFYTCFHDDADFCVCRKPLPGLILRASSELELSLNESVMVGDRWRDIAAGQAAGCRNFFIDYVYGEQTPKDPFTKVSSLLEVANIMAGEQNGTQ